MTTEQLPLPAASEDHEQWRLETLQLVNWGGFHGTRQVEVSPGSTMVAGESGVGKSTFLDSWTALMMPSDVPFNGASNEGTGRARSTEQRNLLTYLRGKQDKKDDGSGTARDQVLRGGDGSPVWGALAGTFANDSGHKFTVMRLYYVKAGASVSSDVMTTFATLDGYVDLRRLDPLARNRFDKRELRGAIPGLVPHKTFWEFEDTVHTRLGIGGGDGGRKAMRLLARMQASMQISRIDDLYKTMVLEKPITYEIADSALGHFANLKATYLKMVDEAEKVKVLRRLPDLQHDLATAQVQADLIAEFGVDREGPSPYMLWQLQTERSLLDEAVVENRRDHAATSTRFADARRVESEYELRLEQISREKHANGGGAIDQRRDEITRLRSSQDDVRAANFAFQRQTEAINLIVPETAEQFLAARNLATEFLASFDDRAAALRSEEDAAQDDLAPLTSQQRDLFAEQKSLEGRAGMVPRRLHEARVRMAEAAGLDPMNDLPFVAELIDVLPDEEHWRKGIETTLGGVARVVLVDRRVRDQFSAAIDGISIRPRIRFEGVTLADHEDWRGDPDYVSGKIAFKESPFSQWVQDRVSERGVDHVCVANTAAMSSTDPCVTPAGQTRYGDKGAHGESGDGYIIGFSNERRLADIEQLLADLEPQIAAARKRIAEVRDRHSDLRLQRDAHKYVRNTEWANIDVLGIDLRIAELEDEIQRLRAANQILDALQAEEERMQPLLESARRDRMKAELWLEHLVKEHGILVDDQDAVQDGIDGMLVSRTAAVTEDHQRYLDTLFAERWGPADLDVFRKNRANIRKALRDEAASTHRSIRSAVQSMEAMFENYQSHPQWAEHNLGTSIDSADGFREILDRMQSGGLHERREKWRREVAAWSSDDLLQLNDAFDTALEEIEDRLIPVNRILETLPFGGKGILQIHPRRLVKEEVSTFRRTLRELSSGLALELSEDEVESRFKRLSEFMDRISIPEGHTKSSTAERDRYLDVRQHIVITAKRFDEDHREIATYDYIADKSGGEMQELVAFIVGSALRYQLGDETRSRPRFAPVFLDEAFIKADSNFAGRAIRAWQDLGFQLVVGGPVGTFTALEPYMDLVLNISKNDRGYSYVNEMIPDNDGSDAA